MSHTWELREGEVLVVEDASTASLVIVARDLKDRDAKIAVLEEILRTLGNGKKLQADDGSPE